MQKDGSEKSMDSWGSTDRVGFSDVVGGDVDFSSVRARAHWLFVTLSYRF